LSGVRIVTVGLFPDLHEHILQNFRRFLRFVENAQRQRMEHGRIPVVKAAESLAIASGDPLQPLDILRAGLQPVHFSEDRDMAKPASWEPRVFQLLPSLHFYRGLHSLASSLHTTPGAREWMQSEPNQPDPDPS